MNGKGNNSNGRPTIIYSYIIISTITISNSGPFAHTVAFNPLSPSIVNVPSFYNYLN